MKVNSVIAGVMLGATMLGGVASAANMCWLP